MKRLLASVFATWLLVACAENDPLGLPSQDATLSLAGGRSDGSAGQVEVMSRNMYFGAPVNGISDARSIPELVQAVEIAWQTLSATDFPTRAAAVADEIARAKPHLVGLQEVAIITNFSLDAQGQPTVITHFEFLGTLMAELEARNADYQLAIQQVNTIVPALPRADGTFVGFNDRDAILVRGDVAFANAHGDNFAAVEVIPPPLGAPPGTPPLVIAQGWVAVDATVKGKTFRFVNTHLQAAGDADDEANLQLPQAQELVGELADVTMPLIVVGDFNSGPNSVAGDGSPRTLSYEAMLAAGYTDVWTLRPQPDRSGNTCCHAADLSNVLPELEQRIDLLLTRNVDELGPSSGRENAQVWLVGDVVRDRRWAGLWPSDHAGVLGRMVFPNPIRVAND
jgi:endonuclease/exonuclease/phosphatase family metal-dependent hydrolase